MKFNCTMKLKVYAIILTGSSRSIQFNFNNRHGYKAALQKSEYTFRSLTSKPEVSVAKKQLPESNQTQNQMRTLLDETRYYDYILVQYTVV